MKDTAFFFKVMFPCLNGFSCGRESKAVLTKSLTDYAFFSLFIQDRFIIPICQAGEVPINYTRQTSACALPVSGLI